VDIPRVGACSYVGATYRRVVNRAARNLSSESAGRDIAARNLTVPYSAGSYRTIKGAARQSKVLNLGGRNLYVSCRAIRVKQLCAC
jgi:hypothetical protein